MQEYSEVLPAVCSTHTATQNKGPQESSLPIDTSPFDPNKEVIVFEEKGVYFAIDFLIPRKQVLFYQLNRVSCADKIKHKKTTYIMFFDKINFDELVLDRSVLEGKPIFKVMNADTKLPNLTVILHVVATECRLSGMNKAILKLSQSKTKYSSRERY